MTKSLGGVSGGASQSVIDVWCALSATKKPINILFKSCNYTTTQIDGWPLYAECKFESMPFKAYIEKKGFMSLRKSNKLLKELFYFRRIVNKTEIVIVDGLARIQYHSKIARKIGCQSVIIIRGAPWIFNNELLDISLEDYIKIMRSFSHIVFVSSRIRDEWMSLMNYPQENTHYIPNCCRESEVNRLLQEKVTDVRKRLGISQDKFIISCVASLKYRKGQDILLDQFSELLKIKPNLELYLVGLNRSEWAQSLIEKMKVHPHSDKIKILGKRTDAMDYIYAADVFMLTTRSEAFPRVILEAIALKTLVVASNVDGIPEMIEEGVSGYLMDPNAPSTLSDAFSKACRNDKLNGTIVENASKKYWSNFSRKKQVDRYINLIEIVSAKNR